MRGVKFKIWDKTRNKWLTSNCGQFLLNQNGDLVFHQEGLNPLEEVKSAIDYEIVRDTGLKDKYGKAIYEEDIIQCMVNNNSIKGEEAYVLGKEGFGLEHIKKVVNYKIEFWNSLYNYGYRVRNGKANFMITQGALNTMNAKKIGNIYENLELLKGDVE